MEIKNKIGGTEENDKFFVTIPNGFIGDSLLHPTGSVFNLSINDKYNKLSLTVQSPYGEQETNTYHISINIENEKSVANATKKIFDHTGASEEKTFEFFNFLSTVVIEASAFYNTSINDKDGFPVRIGDKVRTRKNESKVVAIINDKILVEFTNKNQKYVSPSDIEKIVVLNKSCATINESRETDSAIKNVATFIDSLAQKMDIDVSIMQRMEFLECYGPTKKVGKLYVVKYPRLMMTVGGVFECQEFLNAINKGLAKTNMFAESLNINTICISESKTLNQSQVLISEGMFGKNILINENTEQGSEDETVHISQHEYITNKNNEIKDLCETLSNLIVQNCPNGKTITGEREEYHISIKEYLDIQKAAESLSLDKKQVYLETKNPIVENILKKMSRMNLNNVEKGEALKAIGTATCNESLSKISTRNIFGRAWDTGREAAKFIARLYEKGKFAEIYSDEFMPYFTTVILVGLSDETIGAISEYIMALIGKEITNEQINTITNDICEIIFKEYETSGTMLTPNTPQESAKEDE